LNDILERDSVGLELADLPEAIVGAHLARIAIMREDAVDQLWLEITDRDGRILAKIT
jgi:hypothetical protein